MGDASNVKSDGPVAVLTLRTVKPGMEQRFESELHELISASLEAEGQLGVHVVRPAPGSDSREYGIIRRFTDTGARDRFYNSPLFRKWEGNVAELTEAGTARQELTGLEAWFTLPGREGSAHPPRWKMAAVTALGVWPVSIFIPWLLKPLVGSLHPLFQAFFIAIGIVIVLTWAVMPLLVKILGRWLH